MAIEFRPYPGQHAPAVADPAQLGPRTRMWVLTKGTGQV